MSAVLPCSLAPLLLLPKRPDRRTCLRRLPLLLALTLGLPGCHARSSASAVPLVSVRSLTGRSFAVAQVQASPLYQQARKDCKSHNYRHAADSLDILAHTPGLAPDAVTYVQHQREICLRDAGLLPAVPVLTSLPARAPADADCGPRALLLLCQQIGVKTDLHTLRQAAGTTAKGTTLAGLQQAAQKLGLQAEGVQVSREALGSLTAPALAWIHHDHYVCVLALSGSGDKATATLHDPNQTAEETISQEQLLQRTGGYLLLVHR